MSTQQVRNYPKSLSNVLGKRAALFLFIGVIGFLFIHVVGPILQTTPELVLEGIISGIPLLLALGCAVAALIAKITSSLRRTAA